MTETTIQPAAKTSVWDAIKEDAKEDLSGLESFLSNLFVQDFNAVLPEATATAAAELTAIATGDNKDTGHILAAGVRNAEAAAIQTSVTTTAQTLAAVAATTHASAVQ